MTSSSSKTAYPNSLHIQMIHREVMEDIQALMNEKNYQFTKALKIVFHHNSSLFDELMYSEEDNDNSSFDSKSTDGELDSHTEDESSETDGVSDPHTEDESSADN